MICTEYRITYRPGETIRIKPFSCVHLFNRLCDVQAFKDYLADSGRNTYFLSLGDFFDGIVVSDPRFQRSTVGNPDPKQIVSDSYLNEVVDYGYELLSPYSSRIIGLMLGNHESNILKRYNVHLVRWLCEKLGGESKQSPTAYPRSLGYSCGLTIRFRTSEGGGRTLRIRAQHGWGGGGSRTPGYPLTKYAKDAAGWQGDVFLYGHDHVLKTDRLPRMSFTNSKLFARPRLIGLCGTFLKTMTENDEVSYSEQGGYFPAEIGGLTLCVKPQQGNAKQPLKYWFSDEED